MSLSSPKIQSPCKKYIEFKGDTGVFRFWDKEKKENINIELPLKFIVLDELSTIKGFSDSAQSGIYSNEVHSLRNQVLSVRTFKGGLSVTGKYEEIKAEIQSMGGKFCKSVYAAMLNNGKLELVNFQLSGAAFKSWIDKKVDLSKDMVVVKDFLDGKKGAVKFKIPVWEGEPIPANLLDQAIEMDRTLQEYLKARKVADKDESKEEVQNHPAEIPEPDADDVPW